MVRVLNIREDTRVSKHDPYHEVWQVRETPCDDDMGTDVREGFLEEGTSELS